MGQLPVIGMDLKESEALTCAEQISEAPFNPFLIKDAVVYQRAKARQGTHAVKNRALLAGSGRKLFRQKGTGYARAGDKKATQRRGGGIVHGPIPRSHNIQMNKKVRKAALRAVLGEKIRRQQLVLLDGLNLESHKTKDFARWLQDVDAPEALIVVDDIGENLERASRNLPTVAVIHHSQLNVYNLLCFEKALITKAAWQAIEERLTA